MSVIGPFPDSNVYVQAARNFLEVRDIFNVARTCKQNNEWSKTDCFWQNKFKDEGIPLVANCDGSQRKSLKEDFRVLYPITLSCKTISQFFGEVVSRDKLPTISDSLFNQIADGIDPFSEEESFRSNFRIIVTPSHIERTSGKEMPFDLDKDGNLVKVAPDQIIEKQLTIPFSFRNFRQICKYPLQGKENGPVFSRASAKEIFDNSVSFPEKIRVDVMRLKPLEKTIHLSFDEQKLHVENKASNIGLAAASLLSRTIWNAWSILTSKTCLDEYKKENQSMYVRGPDAMTFYGSEVRLAAGSFSRGYGINFVMSPDELSVNSVIVPGCSIEM